MEPEASALEAEIRAEIARRGPIPIAQYMALCLSHPVHGYYRTRDPLGRAGDFTTAPEISQMFGELVGVWAAAVWRQMGSPAIVRLVELGPGRGAMMSDMLRAAKVMPGFRDALSVHLVETSPRLRERQREALAAAGRALSWHDELAEVPDGPVIVVANEFFDALPICQAIKTPSGWHERRIGIDDTGALTFAIVPEVLPSFDRIVPPRLADAPSGAIYEWRDAGVVTKLAGRVARAGAALVIDYGHTASGLGTTLQAVRAHRYVPVLAAPGLADLTAHVDFEAFAAAAGKAGARVHGPVTQAELLHRLGIETRAAALATAAPDKAQEIEAARARLTAGGPTGMGALFKAIGLSAPEIAALPALEAPP